MYIYWSSRYRVSTYSVYILVKSLPSIHLQCIYIGQVATEYPPTVYIYWSSRYRVSTYSVYILVKSLPSIHLYIFSLLLELCKARTSSLKKKISFLSRIFSSSSDMPTFQTIAICSCFLWLLSTFHIRIKVSTTYTFKIIFVVFTLIYLAVIFFNIELNAHLAISSSHFPFHVIVCSK